MVMDDVVCRVPVTVAGGAAVVVVVPPVPVPVLVDATPAVAVTLAVLFVMSMVCALPAESVVATLGETLPLSVVKLTGMPASTFPFGSSTDAVIVDVPPMAEIVSGLAPISTRATAAAPTAILTEPLVP